MSGAGFGAALGQLPRAAAARARAALTPSRRLRVRLAILLAAALLLAALYLLWFRDSGLVRVENVTVTGLTAQNATRIRADLTAVARGMTTLHVRQEDLERAVADYTVVHHLRVSTDFPHGLTIHVVERRAVAVAVDSGGRRVPVAGDGTILRDFAPTDDLPPVQIQGMLPRWRLGDPDALRTVAVIAAAPRELGARIEAVREESGRGLVAELDGGPLVVLGDRARLEAKWAAAARVLADPGSDGAEYVDVRIPERPVAGGLVLEPVPAEPAMPEPAGAAPGPASTAPKPAPVPPQPAPGAAAPTPPNTQPGLETPAQP